MDIFSGTLHIIVFLVCHTICFFFKSVPIKPQGSSDTQKKEHGASNANTMALVPKECMNW